MQTGVTVSVGQSETEPCIGFEDMLPEHHAWVGGKCASLATMTQAGLPVPPGFAVTTSVFAGARAASGLAPRIAQMLAFPVGDDAAALASTAEAVRDLVRSWPMPPAHEADIRRRYAELCDLSGIPDVPVAVRSSATAEDSPDASFAGEHDTYLWVCGADAVLEKIRACWASLYTDRAIAYRHEMGYDHVDVEMAVGVQKMVRPRAAGVAFTLDPTNGDRSGVCIDAAWGFGEGVVGGDVTPDNFLVDKVMWTVKRRTVSVKTHAHLLVDGCRVDRVALPGDRASAPSLTDGEVVAIAKLARTAEKHYGCPQDIEWAVDDDLPAGDDVVLLQARPETVWSKRRRAVGAPADLVSSIVDTLVNPLYSRRQKRPA